MKDPFSLLIAVPCTEYMHADFTRSLLNLTARLHRDGIRHEVDIKTGTLVYFARQSLACRAINDGFTNVLWLDSDMIFETDIVESLRFCEKDFVCGAFHGRRPPYGACVYSRMRPREPLERVKEWGAEPFQVEGCGMACTMTASSVLMAVQNHFGTCFQPTADFGEDLAFWQRAKQLGIEIWCEPTARAGHIAHIPIWPGEEPAT